MQHHAPGNELLHTGQQAVAPSGHDERPPAIQCGERLRHYLIRRLLVAGRPIGFGARGCIKVGGSPARAAGLNDHPVPPGFEETALRLARGEVGGEEVRAQVVPVVADVVKRQVGIGLDCIGDGEYWSALDIKWFDQQMTGLRRGC